MSNELQFSRAEATRADASLQWDGAPSEVQSTGPAFHARTYLIDRALARIRPRHLLDIGCGRGYVTQIAARRAARVTATDLASDAVASTRALLAWHPAADVRVENALAPGWRADSGPVDAILLSEVLEHLEDDRGALTACRGLLAEGGHLILTVPANPALWTHWDDLAGHVRRYTRGELIGKVEGAGFTIDRITNWGFPVTGWLAIRGAKMRSARVAGHAAGGEVPLLMRKLMPLASLPFRALARIEPWLSPLDRGAGYVVVASVRKH